MNRVSFVIISVESMLRRVLIYHFVEKKRFLALETGFSLVFSWDAKDPDRGALLGSIRKFSKNQLKRSDTVDKSAPRV